MKFGLDKMLEKYAAMAYDGPAGTAPKPAEPSRPSAVWQAFAAATLAKTAPTRRVMFAPRSSLDDMMDLLARSASLFAPPGGAPPVSRADRYVADCATLQYRRAAAPAGVYAVACTEGTVRGQAEDQRVLALGAAFRARQRPSAGQFAELFETRRRAIVQANLCSYEETLSARFPAAAKAVVRGYAEARALCARSSVSSSPAESYMAESVDRQYKSRAVPGGVYELACQDGAAKGLPEFNRVQALSAKFRAGQRSKLEKENAKFENARFARANYAHLCSYEEDLFNRFPAVAAAMRPESSRY